MFLVWLWSVLLLCREVKVCLCVQGTVKGCCGERHLMVGVCAWFVPSYKWLSDCSVVEWVAYLIIFISS